jgi:hypothetical protein
MVRVVSLCLHRQISLTTSHLPLLQPTHTHPRFLRRHTSLLCLLSATHQHDTSSAASAVPLLCRLIIPITSPQHLRTLHPHSATVRDASPSSAPPPPMPR